MSEILTCKGCGATKPGPTGTPTDVYPSEHCGHCPPWRCEDCGEMCSAAAKCSCWIDLATDSLADIKAMFAEIGLSVGGLGASGDVGEVQR